MSGANIVKVFLKEGSSYGSAIGSVTWNPGGATGIDILASITWLDSTDMDTHFIKTGGSFGGSDPVTFDDCAWTNCQEVDGVALDWTTTAGSSTGSIDTSTGAIARMDLDCVECPAKAETVWIQSTSPVIPTVGNFLLCVYAYSGTDKPSAQISVGGIAQNPLTAPSSISRSGGNDTWFVGYISQDASANLTWHAVNTVGVGAGVCKQP